ncbi:hypothetical protein EYF80_063286 [Liparis tanakae]|uniref:Uncharacterized protein n=1 Tax=Liparis tanakae TaxID=230148 RepID=A0A4Z2ECF1_9TELE|nr:hypothetical protein EYF80_063286 [Liparis tanakae]
MYFTPQPSEITRFSAIISSNSEALNLLSAYTTTESLSAALVTRSTRSETVHGPLDVQTSRIQGARSRRYLLAPGELELGSAQRLHHVLLVLRLGAHGHDHLTDAHASHGAQRLPEGAAHPGLEPEDQKARGASREAGGTRRYAKTLAALHSPISSSAGQHLVDADHVEGMQAHADVEAILTAAIVTRSSQQSNRSA